MVAAALLAATLVGALFGAGAGLFAGLVPGFHVNNLAQLALWGRGFVLGLLAWTVGSLATSPEALFAACGFLVGAALGHAFTDEIPAVFLGAPDPDTALSVLPGHRLLMAGHGPAAVQAAAAGSAVGVALSLPFVPVLAWIMGAPLHGYAAMASVLPWLLIAVAAALCWTEQGRPAAGLSRRRAQLLALGLLLTAGAFGEVVMFEGLAWPNVFAFGAPGGSGALHLLSLFAGLFGLPTLLLAATSTATVEAPEEEGPPIALPLRRAARVAAVGTGAGALFGWLPGVGAAQAAVLATSVREAAAARGRGTTPPRDSPQGAVEFLVVQAAAGAANLVFNLVALFALLRMRSGAMAATSSFGGSAVEKWSEPMGPPDLLVALIVAVAACVPLCYAGARLLGGVCAGIYAHLPPRLISVVVFAAVILFIAVLEGLVGLAVVAVALPLGLVPPLAGIKRVHLMGAVLVPVALHFAGAGA